MDEREDMGKLILGGRVIGGHSVRGVFFFFFFFHLKYFVIAVCTVIRWEVDWSCGKGRTDEDES